MNRDQITNVMNEYEIEEKKISDGIKALEATFGADAGIEQFRGLKKGMTNRIFIFSFNGKDYLLRIPGEGTEDLVDRYQEVNVYQTLSDSNITEKYVYLGAEDGVKIEEYITDCHVCDKNDPSEVQACIEHLRSFHEMRLTTGADFDLFKKIDEYESACQHDPAEFLPDYASVRASMDVIRDIILSMPKDHVLCHIDSVPDNFLITDDRIYLIDWEYASMGDPHIDIAMFCIYAGYDKEQIDAVIDIYFSGDCPPVTRKKIYGYIAACAFLWTLWCEIKRDSGVVFPEYEEMEYNYAKEFYKFMMETE